MKKALILLSGGIDSTTLLYKAKKEFKEIKAISFNYGSNHNKRELEFAKYHCKLLKIDHKVINLDLSFLKSSLLQGANKIPHGEYAKENLKSTIVPFRNGIMLSILTGIAESEEFNHLLIANHSGDHEVYPDCTEEFIKNMELAIYYGTLNNIRIYAPFTNISKEDIVKIGLKYNIDYNKTYSCYKGGEKHCNQCSTCLERIKALSIIKK